MLAHRFPLKTALLLSCGLLLLSALVFGYQLPVFADLPPATMTFLGLLPVALLWSVLVLMYAKPSSHTAQTLEGADKTLASVEARMQAITANVSKAVEQADAVEHTLVERSTRLGDLVEKVEQVSLHNEQALDQRLLHLKGHMEDLVQYTQTLQQHTDDQAKTAQGFQERFVQAIEKASSGVLEKVHEAQTRLEHISIQATSDLRQYSKELQDGLSEQSQTALSSLHGARDMLVQERGLTERFFADQLAAHLDRLQGQGARLQEEYAHTVRSTLESLTQNMAHASQALEERAEAAQTLITQATQASVEAFAHSEQVLGQHAEKAQSLQDTVAKTNLVLEDHLQTALEKTQHALQQHSQQTLEGLEHVQGQLDKSLASSQDHLQALMAAFEEHGAEGVDRLHHVQARLQTATQDLQHASEAAAHSSEQAVRRLEDAQGALTRGAAQTIEALKDLAQHAQDAEAAERLMKAATSMEEIASKARLAVQGAAGEMSECLNNTAALAENTRLRVSLEVQAMANETDRTRETLEGTVRSLQNVAEKTAQSAAETLRSVEPARLRLDQAAEGFKTRAGEISQAASRASEHVERLASASTDALARTELATASFTDATAQTQRVALETLTVLDSTQERLTHVEGAMRGAANAGEELDSRLAALDETATRVKEVFTGAAQTASEAADHLGRNAQIAHQNLARMADGINETARDIRHRLTEAETHFDAATQKAREEAQTISHEATGRLSELARHAVESLTRSSEETVEVVEKTTRLAEERARSAAQAISEASVEITSQATQEMGRLADAAVRGTTQIVETAHHQVEAVASASKGAMESLRAVGAAGKEEVQAISQAVERAREDAVREVKVSASAHMDAMGEVRVRTESTMRQLSDSTRSEMQTLVDSVQEKRHETIQEVQLATTQARDVVDTLSRDISKAASQSAEDAQKIRNSVAEVAAHGVSEAVRIRDAVEHASKAVSNVAEEAEKHAQRAADYAKEQSELVGIAAQKAMDKVLEHTDTRLKDVGLRAHKLNEDVAASSEQALAMTKDVLNASEILQGRTQAASQDLQAQMEAISAATAVLQKTSQNLENSMGQRRQENFLSLSRSMAAALNALGVEMSTILEGGVDEKTMSAYRHGAKGAFLSRLISKKDTMVHDVKKAYHETPAFRTAVDQFCTQFAQLMHEAKEHDVDEVLRATLATSDIAKMYHFLNTCLKDA